MTSLDYTLHYLWVLFDVAPDYEECGHNIVLLQYVEHLRRGERVRPVVEGQGDFAFRSHAFAEDRQAG